VAYQDFGGRTAAPRVLLSLSDGFGGDPLWQRAGRGLCNRGRPMRRIFSL